jgi:hypothetical protein
MKKRKTINRLFVCVCLVCALHLHVTRVISAPAEPWEKGKVIDKIVCVMDATETYAIYLPTAYNEEKKWPVLFAFDPGGRGTVPPNLFKNAAETYNYIVVCPYNVKNGPGQPIVDGMSATWKDVNSRFSIDRQRIYATGFSGGARVSTFFSMVIGNPVKGIFACGAGLSGSVKPEQLKTTAYFGIVGYADFNYSEMVGLEKTFDEMQIVSRFYYYDAPHRWAPEQDCIRALEWMELLAMKDGTIPAREQFIKSLFEKEQKLAETRETSGEIFYAAHDYSYIARDFKNLVPAEDIAKLEKKASALKESKEYKKFDKDEQERLRKEKEYFAKFSDVIWKLRSSGPMDFPLYTAIQELGLKQLDKEVEQKKNPYDGGLAERVMYSLGEKIYYEADEYLKKKDFSRGLNCLEIATIACKRSIYYPLVFYNMTSVYALKKKPDKALKYLKDAIDNGFRNLSYLEKDKDLDSIRDTAGYKQIVEELKTKPGVK